MCSTPFLVRPRVSSMIKAIRYSTVMDFGSSLLHGRRQMMLVHMSLGLGVFPRQFRVDEMTAAGIPPHLTVLLDKILSVVNLVRGMRDLEDLFRSRRTLVTRDLDRRHDIMLLREHRRVSLLPQTISYFMRYYISHYRMVFTTSGMSPQLANLGCRTPTQVLRNPNTIISSRDTARWVM